MKNAISFIVGLLFALGLGVSGMTQTHVVKGFLDVFGNWNWNLIFVMAGAICIHSLAYYFIKHKKSPLLDSQFYLPIKKELDLKLFIGAALFGIGWGWAGICPGPGIVSLMSGDKNMFIFVGAMILGMGVFKFIEKK